MNLPNKLTLARVIATPIFMAALMFEFKFHYTVALVLFIAASLTDLLDGYIARRDNLVTDFGKFVDPLADKMLTTAAFLGFMVQGIGWQVTWIAFIVLFREFLVSSLRLVVVTSGGEVIAANIWGKAKTVTQMAGIIFALASYAVMGDFGVNIVWLTPVLNIAISVLLWVSAVLCVISGFIYLKASWKYIDSSK